MEERRIVFVHAHPDDEALSTGGTIARYADEGAHVCLVTCTNGEAGEIAEVPDLGPLDEVRQRLGEIRRAELEEACLRLGDIDLRMLGFHDSGMDGTPENDAAHAFMKQDMHVVVDRIVDVLSDVKPQVLVTYNAFGGYGHPDHIRAHEAALKAVDRCPVDKVYFTAFPQSLLRMARELASEYGWGEDDFASEEDVERLGTPDAEIDAVIDVAGYVGHKLAALKAHRTQLGTIAPFLAIPREVQQLAFGNEHYVLARSGLPRPDGVEGDLFEGLRPR